MRVALVLSLVLSPVALPAYAAHWQAIGPQSGSSPAMTYIDLDSIREEEGYRIAFFLTIYGVAVPNAHSIKLDRITQETAFDCMRREFALRSTVGYFEGREVGLSSVKGDWRGKFRALPADRFSQRALDVACNSKLAPQPEATPTPEEAPGAVKLPGPPALNSEPAAPNP
jgi:hypothetical protein